MKRLLALIMMIFSWNILWSSRDEVAFEWDEQCEFNLLASTVEQVKVDSKFLDLIQQISCKVGSKLHIWLNTIIQHELHSQSAEHTFALLSDITMPVYAKVTIRLLRGDQAWMLKVVKFEEKSTQELFQRIRVLYHRPVPEDFFWFCLSCASQLECQDYLTSTSGTCDLFTWEANTGFVGRTYTFRPRGELS